MKKKSFYRKIIVRFAGDSGDGMQIVGNKFTDSISVFGNDVITFSEYPSDIRAPSGTLGGVSGFQVQFASDKIFTPGDFLDILIVMNPAALKVNIIDLIEGGLLIVNNSAFSVKKLLKVGYNTNPLIGMSKNYCIISIDIQNIIYTLLKDSSLSFKEVSRSKNFWILGLIMWLYNKSIKYQINWIKFYFFYNKYFVKANIKVLKAGFVYGDTIGFISNHKMNRHKFKKGVYRTITGNKALSIGMIVATNKIGVPLFFSAYPITPASGVFHELSKLRDFKVIIFQAEDEIAAICSAIGASYGGFLGITATSGPGLSLKSEALGLAVMLELPLVVINVQRVGPSTGIPTKIEQSDLLQAIYGRSGEAPLVVLSPKSPSDCFEIAIEACKIAIKFMTPVILLSDSFIANSSESWKLPELNQLRCKRIKGIYKVKKYEPYLRVKKTLVRSWMIPGLKKGVHGIGSLEKNIKSQVSYEEKNHEKMCYLRRKKIQYVSKYIKEKDFFGDIKGNILLVGFGSSYGILRQVTVISKKFGKKISHLHLRLLHPLSLDISKKIKAFKKILVCELNSGHLYKMLKLEYGLNIKSFTKLEGSPFKIFEIINAIKKIGD